MTTSLYLENGVEAVNSDVKKNKNLWLNKIDDLELELNEYLARYLLNTKLLHVLESYPDLMHVENNATRPYSTLLSKYETGDFYDWHVDVGGFVTWSYVCYNETVNGGEFLLGSPDLQSTKNNVISIPCINDSLIIFPARFRHRVNEIKSGSRYSLQIFFR